VTVLGWLAALALGALAAALERRGRARGELVARACHELRGPLTAAGLALHSARRGSEAPPQSLAAIALQLRRTELALADLALAPCGGRSRDRLEPIPVAELLAVEATAWRDVARGHGCDLRLMTPVPAVLVYADARRISQAAGNLIANALEHGAGTIRLGARVRDGRVHIEVADDGPGLAAPIHALSRPRGARGRGLAIAADAVVRCGGTLRSAPAHRGARLVLELPAVS
jgi:signal transduction histidine kinase